MPDEDRTQLNPQIATATIGRRSLREIEIFPMSLGDQLSVTGMFKEGISAISEASEDIEMAGIVVGLLEKNIPLILEYIVDTEKETTEALLKEITNTQAVDIAEIVYEQNYETLIKKVKGLFEKVGKEMEKLPQSRRPLQPSVNSTDTDSETSTENDSEKAA